MAAMITENQMARKMENEMEFGILQGKYGLNILHEPSKL